VVLGSVQVIVTVGTFHIDNSNIALGLLRRFYEQVQECAGKDIWAEVTNKGVVSGRCKTLARTL
jgi:hypothetical protein